MSIKGKLAVVDAAEADCAAHRLAVNRAWSRLKQETERAATPGRVIGAGLIAGFVSGLRAPAAGSGSPLGGKLFGMLLDGAFAGFGSAMAAGAAAAETEQHESAATAQSSAVGN